MTRSETLIITAALALAMVPKFDASVEQYVKNHKPEIEAAMHWNTLPAMRGVAPKANLAMVVDRAQMRAEMGQVRAEMAMARAQVALGRVQARKHFVTIGYLPAVKCPTVRVVPEVPTLQEEGSE